MLHKNYLIRDQQYPCIYYLYGMKPQRLNPTVRQYRFSSQLNLGNNKSHLVFFRCNHRNDLCPFL